MTEVELLQWIFGGLFAVSSGLFGVWWKIESRQDKKIDDLAIRNDAAHLALHKKIEANQNALTNQHGQLRDKLEDIWKFLSHEAR